ncbi:MAG: phosphodiester glycosidase family protein [Deinococcota bacterium]
MPRLHLLWREMRPRHHVLQFIVLSLLISISHAQIPLFQLPPEVEVETRIGSVELRVGDIVLNHVGGLGWLADDLVEQPVVEDGEVFVSASVLEFLGLDGPRLENIRVNNSTNDAGALRLVFDFANVNPSDITAPLGEGQLVEDGRLQVDFPELILPKELPEFLWGYNVGVRSALGRSRLDVHGGAANYNVSVLSNPTRLVVDLIPEQPERTTNLLLPAGSEQLNLREGVTYRRFSFPTASGQSGVHVLELAPDAGTFRVVAQPRSARPLSQLARGSYAAINAGYFDTATLNTIGLLQMNERLLSPPSRNRASIGFLGNKTVIDRVQSSIMVSVNGERYEASESSTGGSIVVHTQTGASVGQPSRGAIVVAANRVIDNRIGPRVVPVGGFVIVYEPHIRDLALIDRGDLASLEVDLLPEVFNTVQDAVEAGPLLLKDGEVVFDPGLERFRTGTRILDGTVQQSAIGLRADGTVLFVTADAMTARDLIPLFTALDARDAMRLDSGGSTTLYVAGRVLNRSNQRPIVSAIVFEPN